MAKAGSPDEVSEPGADVQVLLRLGPGATARAVRAFVRVLDAFEVDDDLDLYYGPDDGVAVSLGVRLGLPTPVVV